MWVPTDPPSLTSTRLNSTWPRPHVPTCLNVVAFSFPILHPNFFGKKIGIFFWLEKLVPINTSGWVFFPDNSRTETVHGPKLHLHGPSFIIIITHPTNIDNHMPGVKKNKIIIPQPPTNQTNNMPF